MATNDSPLSVAPSRSLALTLGQGGGDTPVEPTGDPVITSVVDNGDGTLTIQGSNFGSKAQAAPVLVDYADHAYENGVLNDYHSTFTDGQAVGNAQSDPNEIWYTSFTSDVYGANTNLLSRSSQQRHAQSQALYRCRGDDAGFGGPMASGGNNPTEASTKMYLAWWVRRKYNDIQFHVVLDDVLGVFEEGEQITIGAYSGLYAGQHLKEGKNIHSVVLDVGSPRIRSSYSGSEIVGQASGATATFPTAGNSSENPDRYVAALPGTKLLRVRDNSSNDSLLGSRSLTDYYIYGPGQPFDYEYYSPPQNRDQWYFHEAIVEIDPHANTGKFYGFVDLKSQEKNPESDGFSVADLPNRDANGAPFPSWIGNNAYEYFQQTDIDEIYYDITLQRVYLGNAPTWSECTAVELQRPNSWNDGEVVVAKVAGALAGQTLWAYIAGPSGVINSTGVQA